MPLHAEQLLVTPSLSLQEEYNDNVFAVTSGRRGDFLTTVSPGLAVSDSNERASAVLAGGVSQLLYLHNSSSDGLGYFLRGSGSYNLSPRSALTADLGGTRDSSASFIGSNSLVTSSRTLHQNYRLGEKYQVSELVGSSLSLGYGRDDYDNPVYLGTRHYTANAMVDFDLSRRLPGTVLAPVLSLSRDATAVSRVDSLSASLMLSTTLNELWRCSLTGGGRYTHSRFQLVPTPAWGTHDEVGGVGRLSLVYAGERLTGNLTLSQDLTSASGRSGSTQTTVASLSLSRKFSARLSGNLGANYTRNWSGQQQLGGAAIDEHYRNLGASLRYELFQAPSDLALEASYNYTNTDYRLSGTQMYQNLVMVRLTWQHASVR